MRRGVTLTGLQAVVSNRDIFSFAPLEILVDPLSTQLILTSLTTMLATNLQRNAGFNSLPLRIHAGAMPAIASSTLFGPVSLWICHMYVRANILPCSHRKQTVRLPAWTTSPACEWALHAVSWLWQYHATCRLGLPNSAEPTRGWMLRGRAVDVVRIQT